MTTIENAPNAWRLDTPGSSGWDRREQFGLVDNVMLVGPRCTKPTTTRARACADSVAVRPTAKRWRRSERSAPPTSQQ